MHERIHLRRLRLAIAVLLLAMLGLAVGPDLLEAHGDIAYIITYYSNSTYTSAVGERIGYCDGHLQQWGAVTQYKVTTFYPCP